MLDPPGPVSGRLDLTFPADALAVRRALADAMAGLVQTGGPADIGLVELVLAEVLNNIVEHAYAGIAPGPIRLLLLQEAQVLTCRIEDEGRPMPGEVLPDGRLPEIAADLSDLAEGGWGWALVRTLADDLQYRREAGRNQLSFRLALAG